MTKACGMRHGPTGWVTAPKGPGNSVQGEALGSGDASPLQP